MPAQRYAAFLVAEPIGMQDLRAEQFGRCRRAGAGPLMTRVRQGRRYDTEARAAVLDLPFGHLGTAEALTDYTKGNHADRVTEYQLRLAWEGHTRPDRTDVTELRSCQPVLDLPGSGAPVRRADQRLGHGSSRPRTPPAEETA